jgi:chromatin assembly factor 1 subunit B
MWTPPLTPAQGHGGSHSASSSVSNIPNVANNGRRESESDRDDALSGAKKRELQSVPEVEEGRENKKRRIAPIPVPDSDTAIASTEENTPTYVQQ